MVDPATAWAAAVRRDEARKARNRALAERARADFQRIVEMMVERYRPARLWQWGSLLEEDAFAPYSDIDIGLEGILSAEEYFALLGDAMQLTSFPLDIVQLEKIEPEFAEIIRMKGKVVYERA